MISNYLVEFEIIYYITSIPIKTQYIYYLYVYIYRYMI